MATGDELKDSELDEVKDLLDLQTAPDPVLAALRNAEEFDMYEFRRWTLRQPKALYTTSTKFPPNRVYELRGAPSDKLFYIHGYGKDGHIIVHGIGDTEAVNLHVAPDELRDRTAELRRARGLVPV